MMIEKRTLPSNDVGIISDTNFNLLFKIGYFYDIYGTMTEIFTL
jgi:hypothetical protein